MGPSIERITLEGFKSIRSLENFELGPVNILIGANGCGKSNFVSFFFLLREMVEGRLEKATNKAGGADIFLFGGPKVTKAIEARLEFGLNGYRFSLEPTADNRLIFADERIEYHPGPAMATTPVDRSIGQGHGESQLKAGTGSGWNYRVAQYVCEAVSSWTVYHFHDTSETAATRRRCSIRTNERLQPDAGNLAAFLYRLREEDKETYDLICETVRLVAPFFKGFKLRPKKGKDDRYLELEWEQKDTDYVFHPSQLSDGTLRFIALATALLQPAPPATVLIDEPELGLHPQALDVLASLILQAQERTQLIVSTQSAPLLNLFEPEQVVVMDREEGESRFRRLDADSLREWLAQDYTLGELWQKNVYGGGPTRG
jgi:predicted ATPase